MLWSQNHLRAPYGVHFTKNRTILRRPAGGRKNRTIFLSLLDTIRCLVKLSYYIKFHGARTAFCWVIEGTIASTGHRLHKSEGHRAIFGNLNRTISTAAGHRTMCEKGKELSKISIQIGRFASGHRLMFYKSNRLRWELSDVYVQKYILNLYRYVTCEDQNLNSIIYVSLKELRMNYLLRKSAIQMFAILSKSCFHIHHCQSQHWCFLFNQWRSLSLFEVTHC